MLISLLTFIGVLSCGQAGPQPATDEGQSNVSRASTDASAPSTDSLNTILLFNATPRKVEYVACYLGPSETMMTYVLEPRYGHVFRTQQPIAWAIGSLKQRTFPKHSEMYEIRPTDEQGGITVVKISAQHDASPKFEHDGDSEAEVADRTASILAPKLSAHPPAIDLGVLELNNGSTLVEFGLTLSHDAHAPLPVRIEADLKLPFGRVRVAPEMVVLPNRGQVDLQLAFENLPGGRDFSGSLRLTASHDSRHADLTVPLKGQLHGQVAELSADRETLTILTWPPGAKVYVSGVSAEHPWQRHSLGNTPVCWNAPAGSCQLLLLPPTPGPGRWASPDGGQCLIGPAGNCYPALLVHLTKKSDEASLVRGLWLPESGLGLEQLQAATAGAPDLFDLPDKSGFLNIAIRDFARAGHSLGESDARKLYGIMRKTGYIRYTLSGDTALEMEYRPDEPEPFLSRGVRLR